MKKNVLLLLLSYLLILGACAPREISPAPPDYEQTKKMVVDILKTDEGKKAIQEVMSDEKIKQELIMDQAVVKQTIEQTLVSTKGEDFWKKMLSDPKFAESFAKSMKTEHERLLKDLMKDPEYQGMVIDILKNPEVEKSMITVMKSRDFRGHLQTVMTETFSSPLYQARIQGLLIKAAEEMQKGKKQGGDEGGGGGAESEGGGGDGGEAGSGDTQGGGGGGTS